jgi:hypothetical protein
MYAQGEPGFEKIFQQVIYFTSSSHTATEEQPESGYWIGLDCSRGHVKKQIFSFKT